MEPSTERELHEQEMEAEAEMERLIQKEQEEGGTNE